MSNGVIAASRRTICASGLSSYSSTKGNTSAANACGDSLYTFARWHDGVGTYPANGDVVYTDATGCTVFDGQDKYYSHPTGTVSYQISASGVCSNFNPCGF